MTSKFPETPMLHENKYRKRQLSENNLESTGFDDSSRCQYSNTLLFVNSHDLDIIKSIVLDIDNSFAASIKNIKKKIYVQQNYSSCQLSKSELETFKFEFSLSKTLYTLQHLRFENFQNCNSLKKIALLPNAMILIVNWSIAK